MGVFKEITSSTNNLAIECLLEAQSDMRAMRSSIEQFIEKKRYVLWYVLVAAMLGVIVVFGFPHTVYANTIESIFTNARNEINRFFTQLLLIVNPVAGLFLVICFLIRMVSKNQRAVDEANSWIKRILISIALINAVGFIIIFARDIVPDGGTTIPTL